MNVYIHLLEAEARNIRVALSQAVGSFLLLLSLVNKSWFLSCVGAQRHRDGTDHLLPTRPSPPDYLGYIQRYRFWYHQANEGKQSVV